ncbi:MAG: GDP-mannose 4,6-dehydratase [Parachlamydiaceae bacterium]|nr:GDP-mannose 4,6-dehydratase [Parachlamydiaceae bacterium]
MSFNCFFWNIILSVLVTFQLSASSADLREAPKKKALIFGITGQDGAYLSGLLLEKNYEVHGVIRPASLPNTDRIKQYIPLNDRFFLHYGDLTDSISITNLIQTIKPEEIYNLGAQSHVRISFDLPEYTAQVDAIGPLRILEAIRQLGLADKIRFYQASTSELYGLVQEIPQSEVTPFYPRSPYGVAKLLAFWMTVNYREAYGMYACNGILFNHESPLRGENFVTRKITLGVANYKKEKTGILYLGNLDSKRDWGFAKDYVEAMWLMLQQEKADDYVVATGEMHSVREFVELAFKEINVEIEWHGEASDEYGIDIATGQTIVAIDPRYYRPSEVELLIGNPSKAERVLNWKPKTSFQQLLKVMVEADCKLVAERDLFILKPLK